MILEPLKDEDFLYADTSEGKTVALYKGKLKLVSFHQRIFHLLGYMGGAYVHNPPQPPSEIPNPGETTLDYELIFENPAPREWLESGFHLIIANLKFYIEGVTYNNDGTVTTVAYTHTSEQSFSFGPQSKTIGVQEYDVQEYDIQDILDY